MVSHVFRGQHCRTSHPMVSHATKQPEPWRPMHLGCGVGKQQWCLQHMANRLLGRTPASEEACNKVSSQRQLARGPFNTIWTPTHAHTHTHPPPAHVRNSLLAILTSLRTGFCPSSAWICKEEDCNLFIFFVSWHSLATFPVWTAHPHSHYAVRFLSEWMSSLLWLRLVSLELFLQHWLPQWAVSGAVAI